MKLAKLLEFATDKKNFTAVQNYINFAESFLAFAVNDFQAVIVSQNETQYRFFQYKQDGYFNTSRPSAPFVERCVGGFEYQNY